MRKCWKICELHALAKSHLSGADPGILKGGGAVGGSNHILGAIYIIYSAIQPVIPI